MCVIQCNCFATAVKHLQKDRWRRSSCCSYSVCNFTKFTPAKVIFEDFDQSGCFQKCRRNFCYQSLLTEELFLLFPVLLFICFYKCLEGDLKQKWKGVRSNCRRCIQKPQLKQRSGAKSSQLPVCRYYEQLQFLHGTISSDETDGNFDIKFS